MANQFLVQIHDFISRQMTLNTEARVEAQSRGDHGRMNFCEGRLDELRKLRDFISEHFDLDTQIYY